MSTPRRPGAAGNGARAQAAQQPLRVPTPKRGRPGSAGTDNTDAAAADDAHAASTLSGWEADGSRPSKRAHTTPRGAASTATASDAAWATLYAPLPASLHSVSDHTAAASSSDAAATAAVAAAGGGYVPSLLCALLPSTESFETNFASKIKDKHLMLAHSSAGGNKPTANLGESAAKLASKRRKKRGVRMLSSNQRKERGMTHIPRDNINFDMFRPLHQLWLEYMRDVVDPANSRGLSVAERVLKADYHGALLSVVRARSPTHLGLRGILIQETQETFVIVTQTNAVKVLPKQHTVFSFSVPRAGAASADSATAAQSVPLPPPQVFELFGDHLCFRSYERSTRKFKAKATIQL